MDKINNILKSSELILNPDGSIYHLGLKPEHIAKTVITVGDPDRVNQVTSFFDDVEFKIQKREFHTQTGTYKGKRITVISTGIGTDNIDIVLNELDALVNIDFESRVVKSDLTKLNIIRIGTSGAIQKNIPIDSFLISECAIGFDNLIHYYKATKDLINHELLEAIQQQINLHSHKSYPYAINASKTLIDQFSSLKTISGLTVTNVGFYGPQGRVLRLDLQDQYLNQKLIDFKFNKYKIINLEMETSAIYALSLLLGHKAISLNAILANRITGEFSKNIELTVSELIEYTLKKIIS